MLCISIQIKFQIQILMYEVGKTMKTYEPFLIHKYQKNLQISNFVY